MMSDQKTSAGCDRPFPWRCFQCKAKEVFPQATDYTGTRKHAGRVYTIRIPDLAIPTCRICGAQTFSVGDDDRIIAALRDQIGQLTLEQTRKTNGEFEISQHDRAEQIGVAKETGHGPNSPE
jgi:hypothetical protein